MIIDVGSNDLFVCGVVSQGSGSASYWVNTFQVDISEDGSTYVEIAGFFSTVGDQTTQKLSKFPLPMRARYVKIRPITFNGAVAMRAGLVTCGALRGGISTNYASTAGITCHADISNCGSGIADGVKCDSAATYTGALATSSTELCTSQYWVQLDLGPSSNLPDNPPTKLVNKVVLYACKGLFYCGRKLEVSVDGSTWSTVIERSTYYDDDTAPTVEYDDEEDSHGTIFRFDLRAVRYVKVWSSISSTATAVHFSQIEVYEEAVEKTYQFDSQITSTKVTMGTLDNLEISSGDYTFMTFWDASSMTIDSSTLHPLFGTDSTGMNFQVAKEGTTSAKLYHGTSSTCSATVTIESSWNHAAVVYSSSAQTSSFYINGVLASPTCSQFSTSGTTAYYGGGDGSTWTGSLEQAKLYTKAIGTDDLLNFSNWCSTYTCSAAYRRNSRRRTVCSTPSCSDSDCCEAWPTCDQNDCTVDWKYTSRRRNYCFRDCTQALCCTERTLGSFSLLPADHANPSSVTVSVHTTDAWADAGSTCADQYSETLPVATSGSVDRTTKGTYTVTYDCTTNSGGTTFATKTRTVEVVDSMYINTALYWTVQREAGSWTDTASQCYATADTFDATIETMHQSITWDANTRLYYGTSGGVTEVSYTVSYSCAQNNDLIQKTLLVRDSIRLYGPDPHVVRAGRHRWHEGQCEICDTTQTNPGESSCTYSSDNSTTTDRCGLSATGWKASTADGAGTYVELDLGSDMLVAGVVTKGHSIDAAWIKTFTVKYKADSGSTFTEISGTFTGNSDQNTEVENMFSATQTARYWQIVAQTYEQVVAARVAMIVCSSTSANTHAECMCGYVTPVNEDDKCRTDVSVDCIDTTGTPGTVSLDVPSIYAMTVGQTVVTYSCSGATSYTRTVEIRNAIDLIGSASVVVPAGVSGSWSDSSGNFIETGSTCITHEGVQDTPTADLSYLPFTTERTYVINYDCRRRQAPTLQRTVSVRYPHRFEGNSKKVWTLGAEFGSIDSHYEDAWSCIDLTGATQSSSRLPTTSDSVFFDRYFESYISYPFPSCSTGVPTIVRTGEIRHPIYFQGDRQEWRLGIGISSSGTITTLGQSDFDQRFAASSFKIIRRTCPNCDNDFQDIYYRRLTDMPSTFSAYMMMACEWTSTGNTGGTDFAIYPTLADALAGTNAWTSYAFGGTDVGFPGTSGPSSASSNQHSSIAVSECSSSASQTGQQSNFYIYDYASSKVPGTCTRSVTVGNGAHCKHDGGVEARLGFLMYTKQDRDTRWSSTTAASGGYTQNLVCARFTGLEWQYLEDSTWTKFTPVPTDVLLARIEFDNSTITSLKSEDEEFFTVKMGYVDGDLEFSFGTDVMGVVGTSFVARCGEDLWCSGGVRANGVDGALFCCSSSCGTCGGSDCASNGGLDICCLDTLLDAGRVCRDHDDVSCLIPEASVLCGGNLQLNNFESADVMAAAGWTIDTADANVWQSDSSYIGYRGSPSAGISLTLSGYGTLELTFGNGNNAASNTVEVLLDSVSQATASSSESEKTISVDFTNGNVLAIKNNGDSIILVKGLAFKCMFQEMWPRVVIQSGEFDAPSGYTPWPAEDCYHEFELEGSWTGTVSLSTSSVSTASEGIFTVAYSCTKDNVESTRSLIVQVRHPIRLNGLPDMIVRQSSGGTFNDPGAACVSRDLVPLTVTASPSSLSLDTVGEYTITYSCTDSSSRTSSKIRNVQVAPAIQLRGDAVIVIEKDVTWNDPTAQCTDVDNKGLIQPTAGTVDTSQVGDTTVTYSCIDSAGTQSTVTRRVIVTSGNPLPFVQGPSAGILLLGEQFSEPGVCCRDSHNQELPFTSVLNTADTNRTGTQTLFYSCTGSSFAQTAKRILTVNNKPRIFLTGDAKTLSLLGDNYSDDGAVCADVEDGLITSWGSAGLGSAQTLLIIRAGYSGTLTKGVVENIFDGDEASSTTYACESCVEVDSSSYIWVDLGAGKVVHSVALAATVTAASLKVGPDVDVGPTCKTGISLSTLGSASSGTQECDAPLVGRFVTLTGSSSMKVCEIIVYGTVGPAAPSRINIAGSPSGCTGVDSNSFELAGQDS